MTKSILKNTSLPKKGKKITFESEDYPEKNTRPKNYSIKQKSADGLDREREKLRMKITRRVGVFFKHQITLIYAFNLLSAEKLKILNDNED